MQQDFHESLLEGSWYKSSDVLLFFISDLLNASSLQLIHMLEFKLDPPDRHKHIQLYYYYKFLDFSILFSLVFCFHFPLLDF